MSKHTPGPWHVIEGDEWTSNIATDTPEQGIWTVADANSRRAEFKANRYLIASAPELYEALEALLVMVPEQYGTTRRAEDTNRLRNMALAALAKARGEV
jgi:hypothetical protein